MLKPISLDPKEKPEYGTDSPTVECENCHKTGPSHLMINCIMVVGSPGHPSIPSFQCPSIEHWACNIECWRVVAHACIDEHMKALLEDKHRKITP